MQFSDQDKEFLIRALAMHAAITRTFRTGNLFAEAESAVDLITAFVDRLPFDGPTP